MHQMQDVCVAGSMSGCIMEVRKRVTEVITRLLKDIPGLQVRRNPRAQHLTPPLSTQDA